MMRMSQSQRSRSQISQVLTPRRGSRLCSAKPQRHQSSRQDEGEYDEPEEESFESRAARGEYDDDNISDGRGGQLEQELSDYGLQQ